MSTLVLGIRQMPCVPSRLPYLTQFSKHSLQEPSHPRQQNVSPGERGMMAFARGWACQQDTSWATWALPSLPAHSKTNWLQTQASLLTHSPRPTTNSPSAAFSGSLQPIHTDAIALYLHLFFPFDLIFLSSQWIFPQWIWFWSTKSFF